MKYLYHIVMDDGEKFDMVLDSKLTPSDLSDNRWLPCEINRKTIYLNIAHISRIFIKEIEPVDMEEI